MQSGRVSLDIGIIAAEASGTLDNCSSNVLSEATRKPALPICCCCDRCDVNMSVVQVQPLAL